MLLLNVDNIKPVRLSVSVIKLQTHTYLCPKPAVENLTKLFSTHYFYRIFSLLEFQSAIHERTKTSVLVKYSMERQLEWRQRALQPDSVPNTAEMTNTWHFIGIRTLATTKLCLWVCVLLPSSVCWSSSTWFINLVFSSNSTWFSTSPVT